MVTVSVCRELMWSDEKVSFNTGGGFRKNMRGGEKADGCIAVLHKSSTDSWVGPKRFVH